MGAVDPSEVGPAFTECWRVSLAYRVKVGKGQAKATGRIAHGLP